MTAADQPWVSTQGPKTPHPTNQSRSDDSRQKTNTAATSIPISSAADPPLATLFYITQTTPPNAKICGWFHQATLVEVFAEDRYGRSLAHLYIGDDWVNEDLLLAGMAWHYFKYNKDTRLAEAQNVARGRNVGLWVDARKVAPWDWRNSQRIETSIPANVPSTRENERTVFITDTGERYHRAGCRHLKNSHYEIPISRAVSAYEPCRVCNP